MNRTIREQRVDEGDTKNEHYERTITSSLAVKSGNWHDHLHPGIELEVVIERVEASARPETHIEIIRRHQGYIGQCCLEEALRIE